jgi:hypothetical protein
VADLEARFWELRDRATQHDEARFQKEHRENAPDDEVIAEAEAFERSVGAGHPQEQHRPPRDPNSLRRSLVKQVSKQDVPAAEP